MEIIDDYDQAMLHILEYNHPRILAQHISPRLLAERPIALAAVTRNGHNLTYIPDPLCYDLEIIIAAIKSNRYAIESIPWDLSQTNLIKVLYTIIGLNENAWIPCDEGPSSIEFSSSWVAKCYKSTREIIARVVPHCGKAIRYTDFTDDDELAIAAVSHDIRAYEFISDRLKHKPQIISIIMNSKMPWALPRLLKHIPITVLNNIGTMDSLMNTLFKIMDYAEILTKWFMKKDDLYILYKIADSYKKISMPSIIKSEIYALVFFASKKHSTGT